MKVLKLKDPTKFKELLTKRGNNLIIPVTDADGSHILGFETLLDPAYKDLVEVILDMCEVIEHNPLEFEVLEEKPVLQEKGEFVLKLEEAKESTGFNESLKDQELKIQQIAKENKVSIEEATKIYFSSIDEKYRLSIEEAVILYYDSKKWMITKAWEATVNFFK